MLLCAALILGAMAWLTKEVMAAEHERSFADARAKLEERIRLSLWRMDSTAAALIVEENQRSLNLPGMPPEMLPDNPLVKMRFTVGIDGEVVVSGESEPAEIAKLKQLLTKRGFTNRFEVMCAAVDRGNLLWAANSEPQQQAKIVEPDLPQAEINQQELNLKERAVRGSAVNNVVSKSGYSQLAAQTIPIQVAEPRLTAIGMYQPTWIGSEAFLLRNIRSALGASTIQGAWIDSVEFRNLLLGKINDLLPDAELMPIEPEASDALALASFPWQLIPGEQAVGTTALRGPLVKSLTAGWIAVIAALLAAATLVHGVLRLSERRASFVSAVTHELRTPLTTFRLYSDMLDSGAVTDEAKRAKYFRTLRREADRLTHLVENVLAFSRVERGSARSTISDHALVPLLEHMRERFEERLASASMTLNMELSSAAGLRIRGDAAALEHVIFNLVDNAAKYASQGKPAEVRITSTQTPAGIEIEIRDHGPGIPESECRKIFRAFHKSAQAAAETRPGVGLGLALSRRLAQQMGGTLNCRPSSTGACFLITLPPV